MRQVSFKSNLASATKLFVQDNALKKLVRTTGIVLTGSTGASLMNFVSFTVMANQLGPKVLGLFVLTQSYTSIVNGILNVQTWESIVKFGHLEKSKSVFSNVVKVNFLLDLISALVAFAVSLIMVKPSVIFFKWDTAIIQLILLYSFTIPVTLTSFTIGVPRLFDKFSAVAKIQIATAVLKLILVLMVAYLNYSVIYYVGVYLIAESLNSVLLIVYSLFLLKTHGYGGWLKEKITYDSNQLVFVWWTNLRSIMRIPVQYSDMVIISMVMPLETVGMYKVYKEIASFIGRVGDPVNQAIYPEYAKMIGSGDKRAAISLAKKTGFLLFCLSVAMTVGLILCSEFIVVRFYGVDFLPLIHALYVLVGLMGVSLFTLPVNSLFLAAGFARTGFYIVVFTNILYLFTAFYFGKLFGIYGIITAFGIQMVINQGLKVILLGIYRSGWSNTIR
jgi:O-antigen/teichoic acid export membrane protein